MSIFIKDNIKIINQLCLVTSFLVFVILTVFYPNPQTKDDMPGHLKKSYVGVASDKRDYTSKQSTQETNWNFGSMGGERTLIGLAATPKKEQPKTPEQYAMECKKLFDKIVRKLNADLKAKKNQRGR